MMISWLCSLMVIISLIKADPVLRYNLSSCNTLEPVYVEENWQQGMMGGDLGDQEELFDIPRRSRQRNPPFEIQIDFDQYRRNRKYTVRIVATENQYFDSFLLQARGTNQLDGNATLVGSFIKPWPSISRPLHCLYQQSSSMTDIGRPVQLQNLTFVWMSPSVDFGQIRFIVSLVSNNEYSVVESRQITFNTFPVSIRGCGRHVSCFRQCGGEAEPTCPADVSNYVAVWSYDSDMQQAVVSMGGRIMDMEKERKMMMKKQMEEMDDDDDDNDKKAMDMTNMTYFVAMGFGMDKKNYKMMDITACYVQPNSTSVMLEHFYLEDKQADQLYSHKAPVNLVTWDIDQSTGFVWCNFTRPVYPRNIWELDLSLHLYQFYFIGTMNETGAYMPESYKNVWNSKVRQNFTKITNAIEYSYTFFGPKSPLRSSVQRLQISFSFVLFFISIFFVTFNVI